MLLNYNKMVNGKGSDTMVRRQDYRRRGGQGVSERYGMRNSYEHHRAGRENAGGAQSYNRESTYNRSNFHKESTSRYNFSQDHAYSARCNRIKEDETVEDIKEDIARIEKEIQLELKEIRSMKLGL
jgi:hypothetical protein